MTVDDILIVSDRTAGSRTVTKENADVTSFFNDQVFTALASEERGIVIA